MFRVLIPKRNNDGDFMCWICMGLVKDMAEAKRIYGGAPILEAVKQ